MPIKLIKEHCSKLYVTSDKLSRCSVERTVFITEGTVGITWSSFSLRVCSSMVKLGKLLYFDYLVC